jgi:hypothetical protein
LHCQWFSRRQVRAELAEERAKIAAERREHEKQERQAGRKAAKLLANREVHVAAQARAESERYRKLLDEAAKLERELQVMRAELVTNASQTNQRIGQLQWPEAAECKKSGGLLRSVGLVANTTCCASVCGGCGGKRCKSMPGGKENCCTHPILKSDRRCTDALGMVVPAPCKITTRAIRRTGADETALADRTATIKDGEIALQKKALAFKNIKEIIAAMLKIRCTENPTGAGCP